MSRDVTRRIYQKRIVSVERPSGSRSSGARTWCSSCVCSPASLMRRPSVAASKARMSSHSCRRPNGTGVSYTNSYEMQNLRKIEQTHGNSKPVICRQFFSFPGPCSMVLLLKLISQASACLLLTLSCRTCLLQIVQISCKYREVYEDPWTFNCGCELQAGRVGCGQSWELLSMSNDTPKNTTFTLPSLARWELPLPLILVEIAWGVGW